MLRFRYTCARHQREFILASKRGGCSDPDQMDEIRRKTLAWLSTKFPRLVLDHFNDNSCLGCKLEANAVGTKETGLFITELDQTYAAKSQANVDTVATARPRRSRP